MRDVERKSLGEIGKLLGVGKSTVQYWLVKEHAMPLSRQELEDRKSKRYVILRENAKAKRDANEHKFHAACPSSGMSNKQKGQVAEAAILLRLAIHGFTVLRNAFDGDSADWLVLSSDGRVKRVQVKWMYRGRVGRPKMNLVSSVRGKRREYKSGEVDVFVGYDFYSDTAYVFDASEMNARRLKSASLEAEENWALLRS